VTSRPLHPVDFIEIAAGMKAIQKRALLALTNDKQTLPSLQRLWDSQPMGAAFERNGELIAIAGALITHPGVASTFMYATDDFKKVVLEVTHYFKDTLFPLLKEMGCHRVHSLGLAEDPEGRRWKEDILGAWPEAYLDQYGKDREGFLLHSIML